MNLNLDNEDDLIDQENLLTEYDHRLNDVKPHT